MFMQIDFGKRLRELRRSKNLTQANLALKIDVSEQALSKWENGDCLPDVCHLRLLALALGVSVDCLLDVESVKGEKVIETIRVGGAFFEIVEKPAAIFAGRILYAGNYSELSDFYAAIDAAEPFDFSVLREPVLPISDIHLSVNFWRDEKSRAFGFVREVLTEDQPGETDIYKAPASAYVRACTDKDTALLLSKEQCETWELFAYIRDYFLPNHGLKTAENGAQEMEVFDTFEHKSGYVYVPVTSR